MQVEVAKVQVSREWIKVFDMDGDWALRRAEGLSAGKWNVDRRDYIVAKD